MTDKDRMNPSDGRQRRFRITIRVSLSERLAVEAAATRSGITLSAYARHALLGAKPLRAARRPTVDISLLVSVLDRLGGIASTIRAVSCMLSARAADALPPFMERDLARSLTELRSLRPQLLRALGKRPDVP
ncbi:hypothetical protein [Bradyrhizobium sp. CCGUVB14]|uniref:plasmid mobilization protein n=1 Tax=Bradyrhizobium sp. CCGUVB14 TaxID=2949628 RepID=UPI0020B42A04|nr:hypothetical protein [Bradyrhizobium sp. CCGUVB14]MCP3447321.1 hypothetical protein [Bradyrhizobium sp. CCGUVB14]